MKIVGSVALRTLALLIGLGLPAWGQMVAAEFGPLQGTKAEGNTYSWRIDYRRPIGSDGWGAGIGWLNEGHLPDHHRDGQVFQVWKYWQPGKGRLSLGLGAGLYHFYDTTPDGAGGYRDDHGNRGLFTLSALYAFGVEGRWVGMLELNRTEGASSPQTQAVLAGIGLRIGKPMHQQTTAPTVSDLIVEQSAHLYMGTAIQNSFSSESDTGYQVEYRRQLTPTWEWSAAYTNEGVLGTFQRDGLVGQAWYGDWFQDQRLKLAFGLGLFVANTYTIDADTREITDRHLRTNGRVSVLVGFRVKQQAVVSLVWNRTATTDHTDTDLIVLGLGYGW